MYEYPDESCITCDGQGTVSMKKYVWYKTRYDGYDAIVTVLQDSERNFFTVFEEPQLEAPLFPEMK